MGQPINLWALAGFTVLVFLCGTLVGLTVAPGCGKAQAPPTWNPSTGEFSTPLSNTYSASPYERANMPNVYSSPQPARTPC